MKNINTTVMFNARLQDHADSGAVMNVIGVSKGNPVIEASENGNAILAHRGSRGLVWCIGFGEIENSTATPIERPLTLSGDADIDDMLSRLNVCDLSPVETHRIEGVLDAVSVGDALPFTDTSTPDFTMSNNELSFSSGTWAVFFEAKGEDLNCDLYRVDELQSHTPSVADVPHMSSTAIMIESGGAPLRLVAASSSQVTSSVCICYRLA
jgi:hypothetical protein